MISEEQNFNVDQMAAADEDKFVLDFGEPAFRLGIEARKPFKDIAYKSLLFGAGQQWIDVIYSDLARVDRRDVYPEMCESVRRVNNQYPIFTRQIASAMTDNLADLEAIPATYNQDDVEAAQIATRVLKWRGREDNETGYLRDGQLAKRQLEIMWMMSTSEALRLTYYDPKGGPDRKGDIATDVVDFFRYVKDPQSIDVWPPRWIISFDSRDIDWIRDTYGNKKVEPEGVADEMTEINNLALNIMASRQQTRAPAKSSAILKQLFAPPSERHPKGHMWIWANNTLLRHNDLQSGQYPLSPARWFPYCGRLYPISLYELLLADQRQLNLILSQIQEVSNRQIRGDIITSGPDQEIVQRIIDPETGQKQVMLPQGCEKWDFIRYDLNWAAAETLYQQIMDDMRQKAGQNKPSLGQDIGRDTRVGELMLAREADSAGLSWHMRQYSEGHLARVASQKLVLAHDFYKAYRMISIFGDKTDPTYFLGSDLRSTRDVIAIPTPHLTPAMHRQAINNAQEANLMGPYPDAATQFKARTILKWMGLSDIEDELAQVYGPIEKVQAAAAHTAEIRMATETIIAEATLKQAIIASQPTPPTEPGMGEPGMAPGAPTGAVVPNRGI
jgi:hypothetical protein